MILFSISKFNIIQLAHHNIFTGVLAGDFVLYEVKLTLSEFSLG